MVLPLLTSLDVRLSPRNLYSQDQELQQWLHQMRT